MEKDIKSSEGKDIPEKGKEKTSIGQKFWNFIMYGGFLIVLVLAGVVFILIEKLMK